MRVIFLEDVPGTADAGEVREVKNGFARNYLMPRKLAAPATPGQLQRINTIQKDAEQKRLKLSDDAKVVAEALDGQEITIEARVGPTGRLFGAVTSRHIADELNKLTEGSLDHRNVLLGATIHDPGEYDVPVRLYREVTSQIKVHVVPEGYVEQQAALADAGAEAPEPSAELAPVEEAASEEDSSELASEDTAAGEEEDTPEASAVEETAEDTAEPSAELAPVGEAPSEEDSGEPASEDTAADEDKDKDKE